MLKLFEPLYKLLKPEKIDTDNLVFRLHYKVMCITYAVSSLIFLLFKATLPLFILFSAMLTSKQYFGQPIECNSKGIPDSMINTYCWTHGTYTVKALEHVTVH